MGLKVFSEFSSFEFESAELFYTISVEAIGKNKNYRGLEEFLRRFNDQNIQCFTNTSSYPHVFLYKAMHESTLSLDQKDHLFSQAIAKYGKDVPGSVLVLAASVKLELHQHKAALSLYRRAFNTQGYKPSKTDERNSKFRLSLSLNI